MQSFSLAAPSVNRKLAFGTDGPAVKLTEKYRPSTLADVVGQGAVVDQLQQFAERPYPTAFLFSGDTGLGKTTCARALARDMGMNPDWDLDTIESGQCQDENLDKSLRMLRQRGINGWRMLIIDEADGMSPKCKQVLLSSLEDIPQGAVVVLTTNHPERFETRFVDRCVPIPFAADCGLLLQDAQTLANRVWLGETGETDFPSVLDMPNLCQDGHMSFRRVVNAVDSLLMLRDRTMKAEPVPILPGPLPAISGGSPEVDTPERETTKQSADDWTPSFEKWRHGGWYVTNIHYPSGACGCVHNNHVNHTDPNVRKRNWYIACDPRENPPSFKTRDAAARAERDLIKGLPPTSPAPEPTPLDPCEPAAPSWIDTDDFAEVPDDDDYIAVPEPADDFDPYQVDDDPSPEPESPDNLIARWAGMICDCVWVGRALDQNEDDPFYHACRGAWDSFDDGQKLSVAALLDALSQPRYRDARLLSTFARLIEFVELCSVGSVVAFPLPPLPDDDRERMARILESTLTPVPNFLGTTNESVPNRATFRADNAGQLSARSTGERHGHGAMQGREGISDRGFLPVDRSRGPGSRLGIQQHATCQHAETRVATGLPGGLTTPRLDGKTSYLPSDSEVSPESQIEGFLEIIIGLTTYAVTILADGFDLAKADGACHRVTIEPDGTLSCDCRDYIHRRAGLDSRGCKHAVAVRSAGLVADWTDAALARLNTKPKEMTYASRDEEGTRQGEPSEILEGGDPSDYRPDFLRSLLSMRIEQSTLVVPSVRDPQRDSRVGSGLDERGGHIRDLAMAGGQRQGLTKDSPADFSDSGESYFSEETAMDDARRQLEAMGVPMISGGSEEGTAKRHPSTLVGIDRNTFDETVAEITVICNQDDDFTTEEEVGEALGHALASKLHEMMSDVDYHFFHHKRIFSIEEEILERRRVAKKS